MDIVFVHGWGSGPFVWKNMIDSFQDHNCYMVNLGFLGDEDLNVPKEKFIGIGHSLGGPWLMKHYPNQMIGFVSIASFDCFYNHIPQHFLTAMKRNIAKDATNQLVDFWHHAGLDSSKGFKNLKPKKLSEGLTWLSKWETSIPKNIPIKVIASYDDHIVPEQMTKDIWQNYQIEWVKNGGHMIPLTKSKWCTEQIKEFIDDIK